MKESLWKKILKVVLAVALLVALGVVFYKYFMHARESYETVIKEIYEKKDKVTTERVELISITFTKGLEGSYHSSFSLGFGTIDTKEYFLAYQVNSDGVRNYAKWMRI